MITVLESPVSKIIKELFVPNPSMLATPPPPGNSGTGETEAISILFLDIDGVLNSHETQVIYGTVAFPDPETFKAGYVVDSRATDKIAAKLINKLCDATGAFIVLSSSWRVGASMDVILVMLETLGINPDRVIGKTDEFYHKEHCRGNQIQRFKDSISTKEGREYLLKHGMLRKDVVFEDNMVIQSYAIVDDDDDMLPSQKANFVQTTFTDGLKLSHVLELGRILSNDETFYLNRLNGKLSAGHEGESKFH